MLENTDSPQDPTGLEPWVSPSGFPNKIENTQKRMDGGRRDQDDSWSDIQVMSLSEEEGSEPK